MSLNVISHLTSVGRYKALIQALTVRHVAVRYRGSIFGLMWSFLNPLCLMAIYTLVFHYVMRFQTEEHYHLTLFAGLLPWLWTSSALAEGTSSIVSSGHLITKSMFPAHILPLVTVFATLIHFVLSLPILFIFMFFGGVNIPVTIVALPLVMVIHGIFIYGLILLFGSLNVFYRDVQHIVGNFLTFLFFLCPIVYPASAIPANLRFIFFLNPFAVITEIYRSIILSGVWPDSNQMILVLGWAFVALTIGIAVYDRYHERFAEAL